MNSLRVNDLTFILLTWRKWLAPNNASRQQMGFNSAFKGLNRVRFSPNSLQVRHNKLCSQCQFPEYRLCESHAKGREGIHRRPVHLS